MVVLNDWIGRLNGVARPDPQVTATAILREAGTGSSSPLLVQASDKGRYWLKHPASPAGARSLVAEVVVAGCGRLIGAPVCETTLVVLPDELAGELPSGLVAKAGVCHASRDIANHVDERRLSSVRLRDDNSRRHAYVYALYSWALGADGQWLFDLSADSRTYSHDHGNYFFGPNWTEVTLRQHVETDHWLNAQSSADVDEGAWLAATESLANVTAQQIVDVLGGVPPTWGIADRELEVLGYCLESRLAVAMRLMQENAP